MTTYCLLLISFFGSIAIFADELKQSSFQACGESQFSSTCQVLTREQHDKVLDDWEKIAFNLGEKSPNSSDEQAGDFLSQVNHEVKAFAEVEYHKTRELIDCLLGGEQQRNEKCQNKISALKITVKQLWPEMEDGLLIGFGNSFYYGDTPDRKVLNETHRHPIREFGEIKISEEKRQLLSVKLSYHTEKKNLDQFKKKYYQLIGNMPLLGYLKSENPSEAELVTALRKFANRSKSLLQQKLQTDDLLAFTPMLEKVLARNPQYCQVAEEVKREFDRRQRRREGFQLAAELGVAGGCLIAGFFTVGMAAPLCFAVGVGFSGYSYVDALSEYNAVKRQALASYDSTSFIQDIEQLRAKQANMSIQQALLPLELFGVGDVIAETGNLARISKRVTYTGKARDATVKAFRKINDNNKYRRKIKELAVSKEVQKELLLIEDPQIRGAVVAAFEEMPEHIRRNIDQLDISLLRRLRDCSIVK